MATIVSQLADAFRAAIKAAFEIDAEPLVGPSQNEKFGDYQSNAAMGLAKVIAERTGKKSNPREIAQQIIARLELSGIATASIAGPGFVNIQLSPLFVGSELARMAREPSRVGTERVGKPEIVVVDYSGPNVAKEMHVGHLRSTIIGDAISRVLEFQGQQVIRQNHIGDWGTQFGMLIEELHDDAAQGTATEAVSDLEAFYRKAKEHFDRDPAFADRARQAVVALQAGDPRILSDWKRIVEKTREHYIPLYRMLGVKISQADERGESAYNADLPEVVKSLLNQKIAARTEGAVGVFVDGPEKAPLLIQKSDGGYLYGTTDLAAIRYRVSVLHANRIIYTHDSRQQQHFGQVFRVAKMAGWADGVELEFAPFGTMLGEDGRPFKTRTGGTVKLRDLLEEAEARAMEVVAQKNPELSIQEQRGIAHAVGIGAVKYADLSKDRISDYVFSFDNMLALDGNTAPYLQYAHARIRSIFRKTDERGSASDISLESPYELALAKHILRFGEIVELVGRELKPHHLCTYLYELASRFSGFYENCPVLQSEPPLRGARLMLCELAANALASGLDLLGIDHPAKM